MNTQLDQIYQRVRETEPQIEAGRFMANLTSELTGRPLAIEPKVEWPLILAGLLASLAVFFGTPIYDWLLVLPEYLQNTDYLELFGLAAVVMTISFLAFFDWQLE